MAQSPPPKEALECKKCGGEAMRVHHHAANNCGPGKILVMKELLLAWVQDLLGLLQVLLEKNAAVQLEQIPHGQQETQVEPQGVGSQTMPSDRGPIASRPIP